MSRAPKQWTLTKTETVNSFENWRQNLQYILSLDANFAPFLQSTVAHCTSKEDRIIKFNICKYSEKYLFD